MAVIEVSPIDGLSIQVSQMLLVLLLAPLLTGLVRKVKARLLRRQGPPLLQPYRDLFRLARKEAIIADSASWLFRIVPYIVFAVTWVAAALVPTFATGLLFSWSADVIVIIALLGSARFFLALAGMDVGTSFGGIGSSREAMIATLAEPALIMIVFTLALIAGSTQLSTIAGIMLAPGMGLRVSLGMDSYTQTTWSGTYKTQMTNVIDALGAMPGVYVLVTLRSDTSMPKWNANDATGYPTPSTDATYRALVDTFANSKFVLFGLSNEPGASSLSNDQLRSAMDHATSVIRAEEDKLGVPHHIVSVQGNNWTSDISFYATTPLSYDNVVYEVHGYPPPASSYTYANIPVIIGEYGTLSDSSAFFADLEAKQIPSLAWDFDPYSDCTPDLLTITQSASNLVPSAWGSTVKGYLTSH